MRHTQLVVASDLSVGNLLPLSAANEVLGAKERVAEDVLVRGLSCCVSGVFVLASVDPRTIPRNSSAGIDSQILSRKER